ncbi:MAG: hypothetical protein ACI8W7_003985 [Gammaproteobacteria bacterium]|jgi:hypothetical protein
MVERMDTEVQVIVSEETLIEFDTDGCCQVGNGSNLGSHTVRRLACDAGCVRIVEDGKGQSLDVGRKARSISPALNRALPLRDQGCRYPATRHLPVHHIEHWANRGVTSLDNLVQLCPHHHRLVHEGGHPVCVVRDRSNSGIHTKAAQRPVFRFQRPDGTVINEHLPARTIDAEVSLNRLNAQLGLGIDESTAHPNWDGSPMDRAMAMDCMFSAAGDFEVANAGVSAETFQPKHFDAYSGGTAEHPHLEVQ